VLIRLRYGRVKLLVSLYRGLFCARNADSSDFAIVLVDDDYVFC
jgi:hypothetical protein